MFLFHPTNLTLTLYKSFPRNFIFVDFWSDLGEWLYDPFTWKRNSWESGVGLVPLSHQWNKFWVSKGREFRVLCNDDESHMTSTDWNSKPLFWKWRWWVMGIRTTLEQKTYDDLVREDSHGESLLLLLQNTERIYSPPFYIFSVLNILNFRDCFYLVIVKLSKPCIFM